MTAAQALSPLQERLLAAYQHDLPVGPTPFATMASELGVDESEVIRELEDLERRRVVSRVGPVIRPGQIGASTLAALAAPPQSLESVAKLINKFEEVNHNYEREHTLNLWFVVTGESREQVQSVLETIHARTGLEVFDFPLERSYHIDLGFAL